MEFIAQNWWYLLLVAGFAFMMFRGGGCCGGGHSDSGHDNSSGGCCGGGQDKNGHDHMGHNGGNGQYSSNQIEMVRDPVCGMMVNPETAIKQNVDGKTYYFCSESCRKEFVSKQRQDILNKSKDAKYY